jgi:hypothetical protein
MSDKTPEKRGFNESPMVALMYLESIPKASYEQWMREKDRKLSPVKPAESLNDMDSPTKKRHAIGYISEILQSWQTVYALAPNFPSFQLVLAATVSTAASFIDFERDGLKWRSDYRICQLTDTQGVWNNLVIHLPNDGFFYVAENLLPVLASRNARDMQTCSEGWAYLEQTVWPELDPFEDFARAWYGYDAEKKLQRHILYNDTSNRMDICLRCPETKVGIDFVFEPGYPVPDVPEDFWF